MSGKESSGTGTGQRTSKRYKACVAIGFVVIAVAAPLSVLSDGSFASLVAVGGIVLVLVADEVS